MGKVLKKLFFEIPVKTVLTAIWSVTHPIAALKVMWQSEKSGPYISAFILTAIALGFVLSHRVLEIYSIVFVLAFATGMFLVLLTILRNLPDDEQVHRGAPLRKEQKILYSVAIPIVLALSLGTYIAWEFPGATSVDFFPGIPILCLYIGVAIVVVILWSWWNYRHLTPYTEPKPEPTLSPQEEKRMRAQLKIINYFIYYGVLTLGLAALVYFWLPDIKLYIMPYIESFISYVMSFFG